ncbi:YihY/virulence factor BrkB family protein [Rhodobacteraceae bacterium]|nr:YihY/virulence factor BrkB family protein [Paracoccaceae bacterium]
MARGRNAKAPWTIPFLGWVDIGWRVFRKISANRVGLISAGIAFYGLLALFPSITAAVAFIGIAFDTSILLDSSDWLLAALPDAASEMIAAQITEVGAASEDTLGIAALFGLAIAFWSASKGVGSFVEGMNVIYEEKEERGFIKLKLVTIALTVAMITGLALSVVLVAAIPAALAIFGESAFWSNVALLIRWPLMFVLGVFGIAFLYRFAPSRRDAKWRWLSIGAVCACLLWVLTSVGFSFYVQSFGKYNETFGALGGVVIMLTWLWISAFVVLLGAQFDAEIEAQTEHDTTVGPNRPMGERGAIKADTLGESLAESDAP